MQAIHIDEPVHHCYGCDLVIRGHVQEVERLDGTHEHGTPMDEVETYTEYRCRDPRGACSLDGDDFTTANEAWMCGNCQTLFLDIGDAISCCQ